MHSYMEVYKPLITSVEERQNLERNLARTCYRWSDTQSLCVSVCVCVCVCVCVGGGGGLYACNAFPQFS